MSNAPERDLEDNLSALSQLMLVRQSLEESLVEVASFATGAIPGADGAA